MDKLSLIMVSLTALVTVAVPLMAGRQSKLFYVLFFIMQLALMGLFSVRNALLFYVFWELSVIPVYFLSFNLKFFMTMLAGSLSMLAALIYLIVVHHTMDITAMNSLVLAPWVYIALFVAFAVKMPLFPFHTWQAETYEKAPMPVTMVLAGLQSKMGAYGVFRFLLPLGGLWYGKAALGIAIFSALYGSITALSQTNGKRLLAYSSMAHVAMVAAGFLSLQYVGIQGGVVQIVSHTLTIIGLFFVMELIFRQRKTYDIDKLGGIRTQAPWLGAFFLAIVLGSVALPLTSGFVGEFLILQGLAERRLFLAAVAGLTIIIGAWYMLRFYQRVMLGETTQSFKDLSWTDASLLIVIVALIFFIGIFPGGLL